MRRQTYGSTGRRGTAIAASAAALCLGTGLLSGCGSGPGDGYTAVGAAAGSSKPPSDGAPSGDVTLTPLDGSGGGGGTSPSGGTSPGPGTSPSAGSPGGGRSGDAQNGSGGARTGAPDGRQAAGSSGGPGEAPAQPADPSTPSKPGGSGGAGSPPGGSTGNPSPPGSGSPGTPSSPKPPAPPATPAALTLSAPQRAAADKRWCEKVTVKFRNTGGSPARSGTVTFATHIIGALGVDWATITSSQPLPAPISAGSTRSKTYTVCVESWRVPLGMRVETQDVSAVWE
ncbi:hypothetical protein JHN61_25795 [Streptomyces sp. MBT67]|uniref:hypothetical protein n=1 Tax=unclassified Streptomyces TaxID=2593676 RepID=UPI00190B06A4|nr:MULTISPECIES: hypothetical protein [unclassified Streptomyces]MBK3532561.1 hypothetical protein [Streptomyces sp. MBT72]MBK3539571.1 hypothetical protein [Streptomyces sp. MBT67]MBK3551580.1 hypothetical protein [Streptomyces sp. MBT61]MBK6030370.1 hypothetical protein [Streptomyces sp. MBT59]